MDLPQECAGGVVHGRQTRSEEAVCKVRLGHAGSEPKERGRRGMAPVWVRMGLGAEARE